MKTDERCAILTWTLLTTLGGLLSIGPVVASEGNISPQDKFAWSENVGWQSYRPAYGGVTVHDTHLSGFAWAERLGWFKLGSDGGGPYGNTNATNWGVNRDGSGNLSGYAWCENAGWINFNPTYGGVTIDGVTGSFDGYAWAERFGWIHFKNASPAYNVVTLGEAPMITGVEPSRFPRGNTCPIHIRLSGVNLESISGISASNAGIAVSGPVSMLDGVGASVDVDPFLPVGWYDIQVQSSFGSASFPIEVFDRGASIDVGGPYVWLNGYDLDPDNPPNPDPPAVQETKAQMLIQEIDCNPFKPKDILFHTLRFLPYGDKTTLFRTLIGEAHQRGMRVHAWCVDYQGETSQPDPFEPDQFKAEVQLILDWNSAHPDRQFDGIHLNIEHPRTTVNGVDGDAFEVTQLFADLDVMVGTMILTQSGEYYINYNRSQHADNLGQDFCNQSQYVDALMPQMYIVGRCHGNGGMPDCLTFNMVASEVKFDLAEMMDSNCYAIPGMAAVDVAHLYEEVPVNPDYPDGLARRGYYEFRRGAEIADDSGTCPGFSTGAFGTPTEESDFIETCGLFTSEYPYSVIGCWPNDGSAAGDIIIVHKREDVPTQIAGADAIVYWHFEAMAGDTFGSVTVDSLGATAQVENPTERNLVFGFMPRIFGGEREDCTISVFLYDPSGSLFDQLDLAPNEYGQIIVVDAQSGTWDVNFTSTCVHEVQVSYQASDDLIFDGLVLPVEFFDGLAQWPSDIDVIELISMM